MKVLTAYFSASGVTKTAAEKLARAIESDIFEIKPAVLYTDADLDWRDKNSRSSVEMSNPDSRPAMAEKLENSVDYDVVFIGFPIWWYTAPTIIKTFLDSCDLSGKKIALFATSGGSAFGKTTDDLKPCAPNAKWVSEKLFNGVSDEDIKLWAQEVLSK